MSPATNVPPVAIPSIALALGKVAANLPTPTEVGKGWGLPGETDNQSNPPYTTGIIVGLLAKFLARNV